MLAGRIGPVLWRGLNVCRAGKIGVLCGFMMVWPDCFQGIRTGRAFHRGKKPMRIVRGALPVLLFFMLFAGVELSGQAAQAADYVLHNRTGDSIQSVRVREGDGWSSNWLAPGQSVMPGSAVQVMFYHKGPCKAQFSVSLANGQSRQYSCDICNRSNLYISGADMTSD